MSGIIINPYVYSTSESYFLDDYGTGIGGAYSFRKLSSTYSGDCIQIREDGGETLAEIGFDGDYIDEAAILAHCGVNDGYITKWYDQSGAWEIAPCNLCDGAIQQASTTYQPLIVVSGTIKKKDGFVACNTKKAVLMTPSGGGSGNGWITGWFNTQDTAYFSVSYPDSTLPGGVGYQYDSWIGTAYAGGSNYRNTVGIDTVGNYGDAYHMNMRRNYSGAAFDPPGNGPTEVIYDEWHVASAIWRDKDNVAPVSNVTYLNLDGIAQVSFSTYTNESFNSIGWGAGANGWQPNAGELIFYQTVPDDATVANIEANIMDYYGIS